MHYLGIDYGKRKVGLSYSEGLTVTPLQLLQVSSLADALNKVQAIIKQYQIDQVVIGIPESGEAYRMAKQFSQLLGQTIPVFEVAETLTSQYAREMMVTLQTNRQKRQNEDAHAASLILQNYLDAKE